MEITDEGSGFDPNAVPDPTEDENLEKTSGRGLLMMELYMSEVNFNDQGNSVRMKRRRGDPINAPDEDDDDSMFADD
ncbi:MAG: ATP-binding protein [Pirellulaceae bacterium]